MFMLSNLIYLCLFFLAASAEDAAEDVAVYTLTDDGFDDFIKEHPVALVEFYAPWCGHCKKLEPEYEKAAQKLKEDGSTTVLGKVDATVETALKERFQITGFPTLKFFKNGEPVEYDGRREADGILEWIDTRSRPALQKVENSEKIDEIKNDESVVFVYEGEENNDLYNIIDDLSESNRNAGVFIYLKNKKNIFTVYRKDEDSLEYTGDKNKEDISEFINIEQHFLFGPIHTKTYAKISSRGLPIIWACMDKETSEKYRTVFEEIAKENRTKYSIVWLDSEAFGSHAEGSLGVTSFPALVATLENGRYMYEGGEFDSEKIKKFLNDAAEGKLEKSLKSEPVPEKNDDVVKVVVGKNFEEVVFGGKDVLLEVYAPWCGHCKKLEPIYLEFAESVADNNNIIVAKMDGSANESPVDNFDWRGFPSIFFIKAGSKPGDKPETYDGERTVKGFTEYLQKHESTPSDKKESKDDL
eukprot:GHVL01020153.1.p1 GENE.GHVL01020153.1~~GHVL01020153.1.p1  ORF type:complete len:490 (+),score=133.25 GHVL01020153.1:63-1472(+)